MRFLLKNGLVEHEFFKKTCALVSIILITLFYFYGKLDFIRNGALDFDELYSWGLTQVTFSELFKGVYQDTQQPLYYFLLSILNKIGLFEGGVGYRIASMLIGLGGLLIFFALSKKLYGLSIALLSTILLIHVESFFHLSVYLRPYTLIFLLLCLVNFAVLYRSEKLNNSFESNIRFLFILCLLFLTHNLYAFFIIPLALAIYVLEIKINLKAVFIFFIPFVLILSFTLFQYKNSIHYVSWVPEVSFKEGLLIIRKAVFPYLYNKGNILLTFILAVYLIYPLLIWSKIPMSEKKTIFFYYISIFFYILPISLFSYLKSSLMVERYFIYIIPPLYLLIGHCSHLMKRKGLILLLASVIFSIGSVSSGAPYRINFKSLLDQIPSDSRKSICLFDKGFFYNIGETLNHYTKVTFGKDVCRSIAYIDKDVSSYKKFELILFFKRSKIDLKKDLPESFKLVNSINNRTGNIYLLKK